MSDPKNILITGSRGFLGNELRRQLQDARIIELVRTRPVDDPAHAPTYTDTSTLFQHESKIDIVFHLAAVIPYEQMHRDSAIMQQVNVELPEELIKHYPHARHILTSSVSVYGQPQGNPIVWQTPSHQPHAYGNSKLQAEKVIGTAPSHAIVRFSSIIGPHMKRTTMIPKMIDDAIRTRNLTVWGNGDRLQNYIDVRDAAKLLVLCARSEENIHTLGIGTYSYSNLEVAERIAEELGASITFTPGADELGYRYSDRDTHHKIGFLPKFEIEASIQDIIATWTQSL
jgi:UDP-glucose 4-epimerase